MKIVTNDFDNNKVDYLERTKNAAKYQKERNY
jgi:hypothetical protein